MPETDFDKDVVKYISKASAESPVLLFLADVAVLARAGFGHVLNVILPLRSIVELPGMKIERIKTYATDFLIVILALFEAALLLSIPFVVLLCLTNPLPIWFTVLPSIAGYLIAFGICFAGASLTWGWGPQGLVVHSKLEGVTFDVENFQHEKWIFVNGIATRYVSGASRPTAAT